MRILVVIGTRPEAIKMAPLILELKKYFSSKEIKVCVSAQHRGLLDEILNLFKIRPNFDLNIMKKDQDLFDISLSIISKFKEVLENFKPKLIIVHGDTTTTMIATLCGFYKKIKVMHVESGLRTNNLMAPWPEEANRQITDLLSSYHLAPTKTAKKNLDKINLKSETILVTGNTVIDALLQTKKIITSNKKNIKNLDKIFNFLNKNKKMILVTCHRRENFGKGIKELCKSLKEIVETNSNTQIVFPVHPNPNIKKHVSSLLKNINNIYLINPVDYTSMVYLMMQSYLIITDSGGIQEEAPSLKKPLVILRDETERPEVIKIGAGILVSRDNKKITSLVLDILNDKKLYKKMSLIKNPYGDGQASKRIASLIKKLKI